MTFFKKSEAGGKWGVAAYGCWVGAGSGVMTRGTGVVLRGREGSGVPGTCDSSELVLHRMRLASRAVVAGGRGVGVPRDLRVMKVSSRNRMSSMLSDL